MAKATTGSLPKYIVQRVLLVIPMMLILLTMVFFLLRVAPGDPITATIGGKLDQSVIDARRTALGLNRPLIVQYLEYLGNAATFNFGQTITDNRTVLDIVRDSGGATLTLSLGALIIALGLGIPLGLLAGRMRDSVPDVVIRIFGILTYGAPIFFVGLLLQIYVAKPLGMPTSGIASPRTTFDLSRDPITHIALVDSLLKGNMEAFGDVFVHHLLPCLTLGLLVMGVFIRLVRINTLQALQGDYIEAARARGIAEPRVIVHHAFRNALVPVVTVIGLQIAMMLGGAVLTESTFNWPGLGTELIHYITARDYIGVQGLVTFFAVVVVIISVLVDIVNALIDPRVRY